MAKDDWLPNREDGLLPWFNNFNTKIPGYAVTLDLNPGDVTNVADDSAMVEYAVNGVAIFKAEQKEWADCRLVISTGP